MSLASPTNPLLRRRRPAEAEAAPPEPALPLGTAGPTIPARWTTERIEVADRLWGEGFVVPGGEEEVLRLMAPLGLTAADSVLLLGAGAGGAARALVAGYGAWISGHEADPALAAVAAWRLPRAGKAVAKRASVSHWDPRAPMFRRHAFNHALALEALRGAPGRPVQAAQLLVALAGALRPGGHLVLVDVVATAGLDAGDAMLRAWAEAEGRAAGLLTEAALSTALAELGFDVRVTEDISLRHMRLAAQGLKLLVQDLAANRPDPRCAAALVAEAEVWMRRLRLMQAGQVRLVRWDAIWR